MNEELKKVVAVGFAVIILPIAGLWFLNKINPKDKPVVCPEQEVRIEKVTETIVAEPEARLITIKKDWTTETYESYKLAIKEKNGTTYPIIFGSSPIIDKMDKSSSYECTEIYGVIVPETCVKRPGNKAYSDFDPHGLNDDPSKGGNDIKHKRSK